MNLLTAAAAFILALVLVLVGVTRVGAWLIERRNPPIGTFTTVNETRMHHLHLRHEGEADLPPVVFIHGASGNLLDQMMPVRGALEGRAELLFLDRPGHGWSKRGPGNNETPFGQAATIAALMDQLAIDDAIVVAHSFGAAVATSLALDHPHKVRGLVLLAPASHPWPGADTSWYYDLTARPVVGRLFAETLALPGALASIRSASQCVFSPNALSETYLDEAGISLLLRPATFRANAIDVAGLYAHTLLAAPRYGEIEAPTVVISGDRDTVVYEEIHAGGLIRDIPRAEGVWVRNLGHKPDWIAPELTVAAIEKLAGRDVDLQALSLTVQDRIAGDAFNVGTCAEPGTPQAAPAT
ncbi:alpha/beta fold hydrolase [Aliihoeflea sp. 40Bstr573]|uniref:alpha/beta fold hydrolase n=1 Tax=Aliihoeflea sp. 40Bstr573 TaxID=2696467 RepID=UPI00209460FF|nr:alpha/beta hydrolase [Aliihoeflea sp. 40Bstr573]MCO6389189.1 alpha/beta fold hydrolase [Aliihoeflea sp. 40Bstr573]